MVTDPWHFPRGELAAHILDVLNSGVVSRLAIFAPRRKGKTWFVIRDLTPASIHRDYVPVYASLWLNPERPQTAIAEALELAIATLKKSRVPWTEYVGQLTSASVNIFGVGGGVGMKRANAPSADDLATIAKRLTEVVSLAKKKKRRVLLLIDEAQHLATSTAFEGLAKALRSSIEAIEATDPVALRTVFTGSSRTDLAALLEHKNAAFYASFDRHELQDLTSEYTDFLAGQLQRLGKIRVAKDGLWAAFDELHCSPYHMQAVVRELMLKRARTLAEAMETVREGIRNSPEQTTRWQSLTPLEQAVFLRVADDASVYSQAVRYEIEEALGDAVKVSQLQNAVRQLIKKGVVAPAGRGDYRVEDTELLAWYALQKNHR